MRKRPIPDWLLERLALGELPPEEEKRLESRLAEPESRARLEALRASDRSFRDRYPSREMSAAIRARLAAGEGRPRARLFSFAAAAAALAALLLFLPGLPEEPEAGSRTKGLSPSLRVHRSLGGAIERLRDGSRARAGDLVQLSYVAAGKTHGAILSVDGAGVVSLHLPLEGARSVPLRGGGEVALSHAYELDDAPTFERFFFLTSETPFSLDEVLEAARRAEPGAERLPLDGPIDQTSFLLQKP